MCSENALQQLQRRSLIHEPYFLYEAFTYDARFAELECLADLDKIFGKFWIVKTYRYQRFLSGPKGSYLVKMQSHVKVFFADDHYAIEFISRSEANPTSLISR